MYSLSSKTLGGDCFHRSGQEPGKRPVMEAVSLSTGQPDIIDSWQLKEHYSSASAGISSPVTDSFIDDPNQSFYESSLGWVSPRI